MAGYLALAALSGASIFSLTRSLEPDRAVIQVLIAGWLALALARSIRKVGWGAQARLILGSLAGVWFVAAVFVPETLVFGVPLRLSELAGAWSAAWEKIGNSASPVDAEPAYMLVACAAAWAGAMFSESAAALGHRILAGVPWVALYAFTSATGTAEGGAPSFLAFCAAIIAYLFVTEVEGYSGARSESLVRLAPVAVTIGLLSISSGVLLPSLVPGYGSGAVVTWGFGPASQTAISPLVQIRPRLTSAAETDLISVKATVVAPDGAPLYWRLVALDRFDGQAWHSSAEYRPVSGQIRSRDEVEGSAITLSHSIRVKNLGGLWAPAAYQAVRVEHLDADWDPRGSALTVRGGLRSGTAYSIVSRIPAPNVSELSAAPDPARFSGYRALTGVSDEVKGIAADITRRAGTPYEKVLAISEHLRRFRYDERVKPGHSADDLLHFLTKSRAGYCEQFAGSMAVLVRSIGLPSRVAVGFLRGDYDPATRTYHVTTEHAHAWPEVYFEGIGWVPFEPTPRDIASPPLYAVRAEELSSRGEPAPRTEAEIPAAPSLPPAQTQEPLPSDQGVRQREPASMVTRSLVAVAALLQLAVLLGGAKELRTRRRYRRARTTEERVEAAFADFEERVADLLRRRRPQETPKEFCQEAVVLLELPPGKVGPLLSAFERVTYGRRPVDLPDGGDEARKLASEVRRECWEMAGWRGRLALLLSPRSLLPGR